MTSVSESRGKTLQRRHFASQTKPLQECHPERSEGSLAGQRSFAALRMTKRDGLFFRNVLGLVLDILAPGSGIRGGLHHGQAAPQLRFFSRIRA